jgi:hypothetical protein
MVNSQRAGKGMPMRGWVLMVVAGVGLSVLAWGQGVEAAAREELCEVEGRGWDGDVSKRLGARGHDVA